MIGLDVKPRAKLLKSVKIRNSEFSFSKNIKKTM